MKRLTCSEIAKLLAQDAERVCRWLFPEGKVKANEFCVGDLSGAPGDSLKIHIGGDRAGVWKDFASSEKGGDLLDLIRLAHMCPMQHAIKEAKDYLGIRDPEPTNPQKNYKQASRPNGVVSVAKNQDVLDYLTKQRGLTVDALNTFRVSAMGRNIVFPSISPTGDLDNIKYIGIDRIGGKKEIRHETGCAPALFGWHALPDECRQVVITEGQIDAITWHQMGFPALSIPNGTGDINGWIDYEWENLDQFDTIYLSFDMDKPGREAVVKVADRLGVHRCLIVDLGKHKDANDALVKGGCTATDFAKWVAAAKPFQPDEIKRPIDFLDDVIELFHPSGGKPAGLLPDIFEGKIIFRPSALTVWMGFTSHGKSALLNQVLVDAMTQGSRVAILSPEMPGASTLSRMINQMTRSTRPSKGLIKRIIEWMCGKCWIYNLIGHVTPEAVFRLMDYSIRRHGVTHFAIDSLMKLSIQSDDYEAQRKFANDLHSFAVENKVHIHLVVHARKKQTDKGQLNKMDAKGSSDVVNQADQVLIVRRNKPKEDLRMRGQMSREQELDVPDAVVDCDKERVLGNECRVALWHLKGIHLFARKEFNDIKIPTFDHLFSGEETVTHYDPKPGVPILSLAGGPEMEDAGIE